MKLPLAAAALVLALSACGGGGGSAVAPASPSQTTSQATQSVTFQVDIPVSASATSNARSPQYIAQQTTFFYADLQNNTNPEFDNTFVVSSANCPTVFNDIQCTFTGTIPAGSTSGLTWSVAAGTGTPGSGRILSVAHNVPPCLGTAGCNGETIHAYLNAIVANVAMPNPSFGNEWPPYGYGCCGSSTGAPSFEIEPLDGADNAVYGAYGINPQTDDSGFSNPITIAEDDPSGELQLEQISQVNLGPLPTPPIAASLTFSTLMGYNGIQNAIEIVDNATVTRTMHVTYSVPAVTLTPAEFPQLQSSFTSPAASGRLFTATCVPPSSVPSGTNPCTIGP